MIEGAAGRVRAAFEENFRHGRELGASVAVWQDERENFCLSAGWADTRRTVPWTDDTLVLIWSATKAPASCCVLHALDHAGRNLDTRVAEFWPEFAQSGKSATTVGEVLSHQAGLSAFAQPGISVLDHEATAAALAAQAPLWHEGGHGYGPRTFGYLADEIVRRLTGTALGTYWREQIADPVGLDLWIGLPEPLHVRVAQMVAPRPGGTTDAFARAVVTAGTLAHMAFSQLGTVRASQMNSPAMRSASLPSLGGIGSARALAKFYALLAGDGTWGARRIVSEQVLRWARTRLTQGPDRTLCTQTAFSAGFMLDPLGADGAKARALLGPARDAFGHPGAGGSLGFADPERRLGFAFVMNQMETGALPGERTLSLVRALYGDG